MHFSKATVAALLAAAAGTSADPLERHRSKRSRRRHSHPSRPSRRRLQRLRPHQRHPGTHAPRRPDDLGRARDLPRRRDDVSPATPLERRWDWARHTHCYRSERKVDMKPNKDMIDRAIHGLDEQLGHTGRTVGSGENIFTINGCAIAYACIPNKKKKKYTEITLFDRMYVFKALDHKCGSIYNEGFGKACKKWGRGLKDHTCFGFENYCSQRGHHFCNTR
ncbi:uncharacterized protein PG998_015217 [Apiospora kogelbergensis]|uniref:uncharacterized protein n=1 Tax=Apiospora kogelbergensis TaxID=1337665 RepID=UPI00312CC6BC